MYDLEYQGSNFDIEALSWTSSMPLVTAGIQTTQCGSTSLLGGYNIMGGVSYNLGTWWRSYTGLPSHNTITFQGIFYMIDDWSFWNDHFHLYFDTAGISGQLWSVGTNYGDYSSVNVCGNSAYKDLDPMIVYFTVPHTSSNLTFGVGNHFSRLSDQESLGFRDIIMTFSTESPVPSASYCGITSGYPLNTHACPCGTGTIMSPVNSGLCVSCGSYCLTCNGTGPSMCTSCEAGKYLSNGSCYGSCDDPLVKSSSGGVAYCETPCPGQYASQQGECSSSCDSPRISTSMNSFNVCTSPCKDSEYFYEYEKKCYPTCEFPYEIEVVNGVKVCRLEVLLSHDEVKKIQKTAASMQTQGEVIGGGVKAAGVVNSNSPSSALLAGLSSMMRYIRYMKINFPPKVQMLFMVSTRNPISFNYGVNMPSFIKENLSDDPLPYAFDKYKINSNFVSNLWDFMVSLILMLLAIIVLTILKLITSGHRRVNMVVTRILQILKWNFPIMMICGSSGEIVFFASLQLRSSPFTGLSSTICCVVGILMMILVVLLLIMAFKIAWTIRKGKQNDENKWKGFEILYVEYEEKSFFSLAYMFLFLSRNIIFSLILATLFEYPLVECIIINVCNLVMICYLLYLRPLKDLLALVQLWINEGLLNILSINILILGILDYIGLERATTRAGMETAILIVIKTFNFAGLAFMALGVLLFMRSVRRIWKTRRTKDIRSPLQMLNFLFFGDDEKVKKVEEGNDGQEFSKQVIRIERDFRENNTSTIDLKGDSSFICDTTIIQDPSSKIFQSALIKGDRKVPDFETNNQFFFTSQAEEEASKKVAEASSRNRRFRVKRRNNILANATGETNNLSPQNNDDTASQLWFSKLRKLKARLNQDSKRTVFPFETNINVQ